MPLRKLLTLVLCVATLVSCAPLAPTESEEPPAPARAERDNFVFILRKNGDAFVTERYDNLRRKTVPVSESDRMPPARLISAFPSKYRESFAWEENYPRFEGVDYKAFDEYSTTIQNDKYAFVYKLGGADASSMTGSLYFVNKERKASHALKNDGYSFQIAGDLMFYLNRSELTIYDLAEFEPVDKIPDVLEIGFLPR